LSPTSNAAKIFIGHPPAWSTCLGDSAYAGGWLPQLRHVTVFPQLRAV